jgi:TPR repeat protein
MVLASVGPLRAQEEDSTATRPSEDSAPVTSAPLEFDFQPGKTEVDALWRDFLARATLEPVLDAYAGSLEVYVDGEVDAQRCRERQEALARGTRVVPVGMALWYARYLCAAELGDAATEELAFAAFGALNEHAFRDYEDIDFNRHVRVVHEADAYAVIAATGSTVQYTMFSPQLVSGRWPFTASLFDEKRHRERLLRFDFVDSWRVLSRDEPTSATPLFAQQVVETYLDKSDSDDMSEATRNAWKLRQALLLESWDDRLSAMETLAAEDFGAAANIALVCIGDLSMGCAERGVDTVLPFAERRFSMAMIMLAHAYAHGRGVERNLDYARSLVQRVDERLGKGIGVVMLAATSIINGPGKGKAESLPAPFRRDLERLAKHEDRLATALLLAQERWFQGNRLSRFLRSAVQRRAEQGDPLFQLQYGLMLVDSKQAAEAAVWLRKAAESGEAGAQYVLGLAYQAGHGVSRDDDQARLWFARAALNGRSPATIKLADYWRKQLEFDGRPQQAAQPYLKLDPHWRSTSEQGVMTQQSTPTAQQTMDASALNASEAEAWLQSAATLDHVPSMLALAKLWSSQRTGLRGTPQNAVDLYQALIDVGADRDGSARISMAELLLHDARVERDAQRAAKLLIGAAELDNLAAQVTLGLGILQGELPAASMADGERWLRKAEKSGNGWALNVLANVLYSGINVDTDIEEALSLWQRAIDAGESLAANNYAWALCASWREDLQDPARGLELIEGFRKQHHDEAGVIDTHAVCAAANGDFNRAVTLQEEAVRRRVEEAPDRADELRDRLSLFRQGRRYVEPRPD